MAIAGIIWAVVDVNKREELWKRLPFDLFTSGVLLALVYSGIYYIQSNESKEFLLSSDNLKKLLTERLHDKQIVDVYSDLADKPIIYKGSMADITLEHDESQKECLNGNLHRKFSVINVSKNQYNYVLRLNYSNLSEKCKEIICDQVEIQRENGLKQKLSLGGSINETESLDQCNEPFDFDSPKTCCWKKEIKIDPDESIDVDIYERFSVAEIDSFNYSLRYPADKLEINIKLPSDILVDSINFNHPAIEIQRPQARQKIIKNNGVETNVVNASIETGVLPYQSIELFWRPKPTIKFLEESVTEYIKEIPTVVEFKNHCQAIIDIENLNYKIFNLRTENSQAILSVNIDGKIAKVKKISPNCAHKRYQLMGKTVDAQFLFYYTRENNEWKLTRGPENPFSKKKSLIFPQFE